MGMAAGAAPLLSFASSGLGAMGTMTSAQGQAAGLEFDAARHERAAIYAETQAAQTDAFLREELNTTIANIDAVRSAQMIDPLSPTTAAIKEEEGRVGDRERNIKVLNIKAQAEEERMAAAYKRQSAGVARRAGMISAGAGLLGGASKLFG